ncbi:uncharacterized membrane protein YsdA (DUF1294 family)/cold shock CspA family protein [Cryobacterium mesophilum]|uniref:cold shock and DUF1294 domain-containing protein n=1 Tax=Terrimesophilobacter mesophilus TaxID=433647 RepID=UPI0014256059|nr:cold shock and DUF1294 domain-containing protein [Terrimesophilobacter mesophilus]MBB5633513.1 uncharacterized membrane protein YsdA (DUF1294 family)/cold shock CspA family protein [Terrimesophilobacter mesophilus]
MTTRHSGVVTNWHDERGFGFIAPDGGGPDLFLHMREFQGAGQRPHDGMTVTYEPFLNREGQLRALHVVEVGEKWSHAPAAGRIGTQIIGYLAVACFLVIMVLEVEFWGMPAWVFAIYGGVSIISFALYWQDKRAAIAGTWRVPEEQLHLLGLVGGWPGGIVAQNLFRHKTKKERFARYFWFTVALNVLAFVAIGTIIRFDWISQLMGS